MRHVKPAIRIAGAIICAAVFVAAGAVAQGLHPQGVVAQELDPQGAMDLQTLQRLDPASAFTVTTQCVTDPLTCKECIYLDTYNPTHTTNAPQGNPWVMGPTLTSHTLSSGQAYLITVSGSFSLWYQSVWTGAGTISGTPGTYPEYPSPGTTNGYTGVNMECLFAFPGTLTVPFSFFDNQSVSLDEGTTWVALPIMGGQSCHSNNVYKFLVEGKGKKLAFRYTDAGPTADNSGQLKLCVQKLNPCS